MTEPKYHPLIDCDTDGTEKTPLFFSYDAAAVSRSHRMYLEEIIPRYYRLRSVGGTSAADAAKFTVHCPLCGKGMKPISSPLDAHRLAIYCCRNCNE